MNSFQTLEHRLTGWLYRHPKISAVLATLALTALTLFFVFVNQLVQRQNDEQETSRVVREIETNIGELLHNSELAAISLSQCVDEKGVPRNFDSVAAQIIRTATYIDVLELVPDGVIQYAYPLEGNESVIGYDILEDPKVNKEAQMAISKNEMFFAGPIDLKQGGTAVIGRLPLFREGEFWGLAAVLIHLDNLLKYAGIENKEGNAYRFQFSKIDPNTGEEKDFLPEVDGMSMAVQHKITSIPEGHWNIHVLKQYSPNKLFLTSSLMVIGLVLSIFGGSLVYMHLNRGKKLAAAHQRLEWQHKEMLDGINSARYVQRSVLMTEKDLHDHFSKAFLLFQPKDEVSGDFFWVQRMGDECVVAAVDCTGHGVAAGLMSMMAVQMLYQIVAIGKETRPGAILQKLDEMVTATLQNNVDVRSLDGMDVALCTVDLESGELSFAGAQRPLYIGRPEGLEEIAGSKVAIGGHRLQVKEYQEHQITLNSGETIYLTSDGFHSQFGGSRGKKLGRAGLRKHLAEVAKLPIDKQEQKLKDVLKKWQGNEAQVDDILIVGIQKR